MKRKQSFFLILILMTLFIASCTPPEVNRPEEPVISQSSKSSPDLSSSAAELYESDHNPAGASVGDDADLETGPTINLETHNAAIREILRTVEEGGYVIYGALDDTEHVELLHEWVACFQAGESAQPLYLLQDGYGTPDRLRLLEYEEGSHYKVTDCISGESWESAVIVKRAVDYVFGTDLPRDEYGTKAAACIVTHKPLSAVPLEYDLELTSTLGSIAAEEACELAILQNSRWPRYSGYAGGLWMPNSQDPHVAVSETPVEGTTVATVTGAVELMGMPCYLIFVEWEMVNGFSAGNALAVSADGRLIYSEHEIVREGHYSLAADYDEQYIVAVH